MSMISGQIDRLRSAAQTYRKMGDHSAEGMLLDAADTITELRGALSVASVDYRHLSAENTKLRGLVQRMRRYMVDAVEHCGYDAQTTGYTMLGSRLEECEDAMRELGIEVE